MAMTDSDWFAVPGIVLPPAKSCRKGATGKEATERLGAAACAAAC